MRKVTATLLLASALALGAGKAYWDHQLNQYLTEKQPFFSYQTAQFSWLGNITVQHFTLHPPRSLSIANLKLSSIGSLLMGALLPTTSLLTLQIGSHPIALPGLAYLPLSLEFQDANFAIHTNSWEIPLLAKSLGYAPFIPTPQDLQNMGYSHLQLQGYLHLTQVATQLQTTVELTDANWGKFTLSINWLPLTTPVHWPLRIEEFSLHQITLHFQEAGLIKKMVAHWAQTQGTDRETPVYLLITQLNQSLTNWVKMTDGNFKITGQQTLFTKLTQFLTHPDLLTLTITMTPPLKIDNLLTVHCHIS